MQKREPLLMEALVHTHTHSHSWMGSSLCHVDPGVCVAEPLNIYLSLGQLQAFSEADKALTLKECVAV